MTSQIPTADEVARIIIASFRTVGADPLMVTVPMSQGRPSEYLQRISNGRTYAALVLRRLFPSLRGTSISRMVGARSNFEDEMSRDVRRGKLRWYDETDFRAILARCGVERREPEQVVVDETEVEPEITVQPAPVAPSALSPYPVRHGAKKRLEDELREAVLNTARMQQPEI